MFNPKVSIIVPVYNWSDYVAEAIDSALAQTYKNIEILVINDWSNDNWATEKIALSYWDKIKYFFKKNGGVATALNFWIEKMTWDYFSWLSHDDLYYPNKIKEQIDYLNRLQDKCSIISSNFSIINSDWSIKWYCKVKYNNSNIFKKLLINWSIHWCTLLIPKDIFEKVGLFNTGLKTVQDIEMWFRIIKKWYKFYNLNKYLLKSRQHISQDSITKRNLCQIEKKMLEKLIFSKFKISNYKCWLFKYLPNAIFTQYLKFMLYIQKQKIIINMYMKIKNIITRISNKK